MKALVTGIEGFVGPYLSSFLVNQGIEVFGTFFAPTSPGNNLYHMDVTNKQEVESVIQKVCPDHVFHLAGFSSVAASFSNPYACKKINVEGTKNLLDAIASTGIKTKILIVSSAEVYGKPRFIPITEKHPVNPLSPYAESRVEQERACLAYAKEHKLDIVISRSFNHSGPGQSDTFVLSSFAKQIAMIEKGKQSSLKVGNLDAIRDFSDVRDVVKVYYLLLKRGKSKEIYNVCSGKGYSIKELLEMLIKKSSMSIVTESDPARLRKSDIPILVGDNSKCVKRTRWQRAYPIEKELADILAYWREKV